MGVHELWSILEPVRKSVPLYSLSGKTLAVDLSLWVCEAQHVQAMMGRVTKPHLRNLFFRVSSLTLMGVKLVFVMEGEAPKLKAETMSKRNQGRFGRNQKAAASAAAPKLTTHTNRGRFKAVLRECAEMLDYMGVPWVTAAGEAEAMCAYLDSQGLVDGCITNDGDAFLYGAQTVYRNFNMNSKDPQVDCYQTCDVQRKLQLSRENMIGLAIFLGCDYIPKGIHGVGKEQALKLIYTLEGQTVLQKFNQWNADNSFLPEPTAKKVPHCNVCRHPGSAKAHEKSGCLFCDSARFCEPQDFDYHCPCEWHHKEQSRQALSLEINIRKKALAHHLFPFTEIINEFLISKDKPISFFQRRQPNMLLIQKFAYDKMEWPKHYTSEKILVLMTYTNLINKRYGKDVSTQVKPLRIFKPRVRNGVSCFEVIWMTPEHYAFPEDAAPENQDEVRTVEEESLFRMAYPELVENFQKEKALAEETKTKKKKPKMKPEKAISESDGISDLLAQMTLQHSSSQAEPSPKLPLSISTSVESEIVMSTTGVSHKREEKAVSLGVGNSSESLQSTPESEEPASLSDSAVISALHLSDIDWESASFTSSPLPPANNVTEQQKLTEFPCYHKKDNGEDSQQSKILKATDPMSLYGKFDKERPLLERVILKNKAGQSNRNDTSRRKPLSSEIIAISDDDEKPDTKSELSGKVIPKQEMPKNMQHLSETKATKPALHVSKQQMKASAVDPVITLSTNTCSAPTKPPQKFKFVKTVLSSSSIQQRSSSDSGQSDEVKTRMTTKKSVCVSGGLSSGDSDSENTAAPQRESKNKIKAKQRDISTKPFTKAVKTKMPDKSSKSRSHSLEVGTTSVIPQSKRDVSRTITADFFIHNPASPAKDLDSDDSVICSDSPLPLVERLKLKFQK